MSDISPQITPELPIIQKTDGEEDRDGGKGERMRRIFLNQLQQTHIAVTHPIRYVFM